MKKIHLIFFLLSLTVFSCRKDTLDTVTKIVEEEPEILVRNTLRGRVVAENGNPIADALVKIRQYSTRTDSDGRFKFDKIDVPGDGGLVTVELAGHFPATKYINFAADASSFSQLTLLEKGVRQLIQSDQVGEVSVAGGAKIKFEANTIVKSNGSRHSGTVEVSSRYLDPLAANLGAIMPGQLTATDEDGNPLALATYGMVVFELADVDGNPLELDEGATATIEMPIPADLDPTAPDPIDLWYFDLDEEQWLLSGKCQKSSGKYICNVPRSGFWNCDVPYSAICLSGQVFNSDSTFASYVKVIVEDLTDNFIYWGYTDSTGVFCGSVPGAAPLRITILDHCDNVLFTEEIGPYAEDFDLDDIYLDVIVETYLLQFTGMVSHCVTTDVPDGHVAIRYPGNLRVFPYQTGGFDIPIGLKCTDFPEMEVTIYSSSQFQSSEPVIHTIFEDLDLGPQLLCETITDFINLNFDGVDYQVSPTQWSLKPNQTSDWLILEGVVPYGEISIELRNYSGEGQYDVNAFFNITNNGLFPDYPNLTALSPEITVSITEDDGEFITGNVTGSARDLSNTSHPIEIEFVVRKAP